MQRIADRIRASLSLRVFLPVLAAALLATWYGLSPSLEHFAGLTGGLRFVDMQPALTPAALLEQVRAYSPETVRYYLWWSLFDFAWPFLTYTAMLFITAWLLRSTPPAWQRRFPLLVIVAYTTVLMDWGENLGFVSLALGLGDGAASVAWLAVQLHRAKLIFNLVFNVGFLLVLARAIIARLPVARVRH
jgi:hypothetical protein